MGWDERIPLICYISTILAKQYNIGGILAVRTSTASLFCALLPLVGTCVLCIVLDLAISSPPPKPHSLFFVGELTHNRRVELEPRTRR